MDNKNKIEIRSTEVQEILGAIPSGLVRYGTILLVSVILFILFFSFIFRYPDIICSKIVVTNENPPATLVARATGKIEVLLAQDKQNVDSGQVIAVIENPANHIDVLRLEQQLAKFELKGDSAESILFQKLNKNLQLGAVQEYYSSFLKKYGELNVFLEQNYHQRMNESLIQQLKMAQKLFNILEGQSKAAEQEYQLKNRQLERISKLFDRELVSVLEYEQAEGEMLIFRSKWEGMKTDLAQKQIDIEEKRQEIINNQKLLADANILHKAEVNEALNNLKSEISDWELTYLLRTPISGVVTFNKFWNENQNITEGDRVVTIVPADLGELIGKVELPVMRSGKVVEGLDVNIKFDNFPYMEFGIVRAKVKNVSLVSEDNFYMVEVAFSNGLITNYHKNLQIQTELSGQAEIITDNLRLIQRFFNPLKSLWKERVNH